MSDFNPEAFLQGTTTEANATTIIPCPPGEYPGMIKEVKVRRQGDYTVMDIQWQLASPEVEEKTGRKPVNVRQSVFLDIGPSGGLLGGEGKNVQLGRVRKAVNQNQEGQPWAPIMLKGQTAKVKVVHDPDKQTGDIYDKVVAVTTL